ncbi:hypothetical protein AV530_000167 [Patagioenas fasciata monilis]|uniref:G-protein coupled receptors family 1 profile domain-containing protein n=1 Tax=Patagioenas fasciata monilis TaxID=372326 RepID=A0A1V4J2G8_PATFA|nr:hypothetical protein AV530_000167 [Patagioenas fasciata monilis]
MCDTKELQLLRFCLFPGIFLAALLGNGLIITTIAWDQHLHTPMYFFLLNLSLLDLGCISTSLPKSMANALWETRAISYTGCATQVFLFIFAISMEYCLLTIMSYDRYIAICNTLLHAANTFSLPLCKGNAVDQFFCEIPQILKLSCSYFYLMEVRLLAFIVFSF